MRNSIGGGIINVFPAAAYLPVPGMAVYAAGHKRPLCFAELPAKPLAKRTAPYWLQSDGSISGPTRTGIFDVASGGKGKQLPGGSMAPEEVVKRALDAFEKRSVVSGLINKIIASGSRLRFYQGCCVESCQKGI